MSTQPFPTPIPIPIPILQTLPMLFKKWETYLQQQPPNYQNFVSFKLVTLSWDDTFLVYGTLDSAGAQDVLSGKAKSGDDDVNWENDSGWVGKPFQNFNTLQVTSVKLMTVNGAQVIRVEVSNATSPAQPSLVVDLTAIMGKDPYSPGATMLSGTLENIPGKVMATFLETVRQKV